MSEEMRRTLASLRQEASVWRQRAMQVDETVWEEFNLGRKAYALKQASYRDKMHDSFRRLWSGDVGEKGKEQADITGVNETGRTDDTTRDPGIDDATRVDDAGVDNTAQVTGAYAVDSVVLHGRALPIYLLRKCIYICLLIRPLRALAISGRSPSIPKRDSNEREALPI